MKRFARVLLISVVCAAMTVAACAQTTPGATDTQGQFSPRIYMSAQLGPRTSASSAPMTMMTATASTQLLGQIRFSAEAQQWIPMSDNTAYFRDFYTGIETVLTASHDGQTWNATEVSPAGGSISGYPIMYRETVGDQHQCFSSAFMPTYCGSNVLYVQWYGTTQCGIIGEWKWNLTEDNVVVITETFKMLPQVGPEQKMKLYNQGNYAGYSYDSICMKKDLLTGTIVDNKAQCTPPETLPWDNYLYEPYTIRRKGCFLNAAAMLLTYHGIDVDPVSLNRWLRNHHGYDLGGAIYPVKIEQYAKRVAGVNLTYKLARKGNELRGFLCQYGPQLLQTKYFAPDEHWGAVFGMDAPEKNAFMYDSNGGHITDYLGTYNGTTLSNENLRPFGVDGAGAPRPKGFIYIAVHSPATLMLTDPSGLTTGLDTQTQHVVSQIPYSAYETGGYFNFDNPEEPDPDPSKRLEVGDAAEGEYTLDLVGTAAGKYTLEFMIMDMNENEQSLVYPDVPISLNEKQSFKFTFSATSGVSNSVQGGFDGGGQRPKDVNRLLSYARPTSSSTALPTGTTSYSIVVFYGGTTLPATFKADLNGSDVTGQFHPVPNTMESVTLTLQPGSNVLKLATDGTIGSRTATDTDRLVFKVQ